MVPKRAGDDPLTRFTTTYMSDSQFGGHLDIGRRFGENKEFGVRFSVYRDGEGPIKSKKTTHLFSLGLDWRATMHDFQPIYIPAVTMLTV